MSEKLSEQHLRVEKVEALKARLLGEIHFELEQELFDLRNLTEREVNTHPDFVRESIYKLHNLYVLEDRLKYDKGLFMRYSFSDEKQDAITYTVGYDTLEWMEQNNRLLSNILFAVERRGAPIESVLKDEFFAYSVFGPFERRAWRDQKDKKVDNEKCVDALIGEATERSSTAHVAGNNKSKDEYLIEH